MKKIFSHFAAVTFMAIFIGGCVSDSGETPLVSHAAQTTSSEGSTESIDGFDAITFGMVSISETFCIQIVPYDEERISSIVKVFAKQPVVPVVRHDSATWVMPGPDGRVILIERDPRPNKLKCKVSFSEAHAETAFYWLDKYSATFAAKASGELVKIETKTVPEKGLTVKSNVVFVNDLPVLFAAIASTDGSLAVLIGDYESR